MRQDTTLGLAGMVVVAACVWAAPVLLLPAVGVAALALYVRRRRRASVQQFTRAPLLRPVTRAHTRPASAHATPVAPVASSIAQQGRTLVYPPEHETTRPLAPSKTDRHALRLLSLFLCVIAVLVSLSSCQPCLLSTKVGHRSFTRLQCMRKLRILGVAFFSLQLRYESYESSSQWHKFILQ